MTFDITTAPKRDSKRWKLGKIDWDGVLEMIEEPAGKKECGNYLMGRLKGDRRSKNTIISRGILTLDIDKAPQDFDKLVSTRLHSSFAAHTTFQSTPDSPRWRLLVPLSREVTPDEYHAAAELLMDEIGRDFFDPGSSQPERYMFKPSAEKAGNYQKVSVEGEPLDVDILLKDFVEDLSSRKTPRSKKRDPYEIEGTVGAFNRAYGIAEAIEAFDLPYESDGEQRWHLVGARAISGLNEVSEGLVFSHHVTDPAWGKTCSAFDLVRLHKFGDMDEGVSPQTPVNRLPSNEAMLELASLDANVVRELVGGDFADELSDMADGVDNEETADWRTKLALHPKTGAVLDHIKNWDLIIANEPVFSGLAFNEVTFAMETQRDLPWRSLKAGGSVFTGADRAELNHYLERRFNLRPSRTLTDEFILAQAFRNRYNPITGYLDTLEWDGVERLETCLPGVVPTKYTRMVARKCLTAAVARAYQPGVKWDHVLVLQGAQSLGKTYWTSVMSKGFSAPLGRLDSKDTLLALHRSWIVMADEGYSLRKADSDTQKEFLTRTEDVFRLPYERETLAYKRRFVIWSTTNDKTFLRSEEGNRRYLPVQCEDRVDFSMLTEEYVNQIWAEARHLWESGETLFLDDEQVTMSEGEQERFTEEDVESGLIGEFLETLVPADWDDLSPEGRFTWHQERADGFASDGIDRLDRVCSAQIWAEAYGRRVGDRRRIELLEISKAMKDMPGWISVGQRWNKHYGKQLTFERDTTEKDLEDLI